MALGEREMSYAESLGEKNGLPWMEDVEISSAILDLGWGSRS
jgi:hypothetical protein